MEEKIMPSGAILRVTLAPFPDAKKLYGEFLAELRGMNLAPDREIETELLREIFLIGFSSKKLEAALAPCLLRCLYNDIKITDAVFETSEARADYGHVIFEVAYANLHPFMKNLPLLLKSALGSLKVPASTP